MIEQPLKPFVGRNNAKGKTIRFYTQYYLVRRHGYGPAVTGIFKIGQKHIGGRISVGPEIAVKMHRIQESLRNMRHNIRISFPEIDQLQIVLSHAVHDLCMQNTGYTRY